MHENSGCAFRTVQVYIKTVDVYVMLAQICRAACDPSLGGGGIACMSGLREQARRRRIAPAPGLCGFVTRPPVRRRAVWVHLACRQGCTGPRRTIGCRHPSCGQAPPYLQLSVDRRIGQSFSSPPLIQRADVTNERRRVRMVRRRYSQREVPQRPCRLVVKPRAVQAQPERRVARGVY